MKRSELIEIIADNNYLIDLYNLHLDVETFNLKEVVDRVIELAEHHGMLPPHFKDHGGEWEEFNDGVPWDLDGDTVDGVICWEPEE